MSMGDEGVLTMNPSSTSPVPGMVLGTEQGLHPGLLSESTNVSTTSSAEWSLPGNELSGLHSLYRFPCFL